jgi:tRNA 2-(methylsulfanyl)-N6-isopentenyladenosine37 hydroxylase
MNGIADILAAPTPPGWVEAAAQRWRELLVDHASCEKKAASTALALIFAYPEDRELTLQLSRLAREELRHFERVLDVMTKHGVEFTRLRPGRYASALRAATRTTEPGRKLDMMLVGALIEARSCERFLLLAPCLPPAIGAFYAELERSEARHFELYLDFAQRVSPDGWQARLEALAQIEAEVATAPDTMLRFHSGAPFPPGGYRFSVCNANCAPSHSR